MVAEKGKKAEGSQLWRIYHDTTIATTNTRIFIAGRASPRAGRHAGKNQALEQQIQELKVLKAQQDVGKQKAEQCLKAVGRDKFCNCIGENLPADVSFEQYIHTMVTSREELGYSAMPTEQKKKVDATLETREKCVEKGFFK